MLLFGAVAPLGIARVVRHGLQQAAHQATDAPDDSARIVRGDEPLA
jgi:hypothetical protein